MDAVSNVPELLENILLELPIKSLLVVQRVSKTFHATITGSPRLQQALFFKPLPVKPLKPETGVHVAQWLDSPDDQMYHNFFANPFYDKFRKIDVKTTDDCSQPNAPAFNRPQASWRRMLVCQPPITSVPPDVSTQPARRDIVSSGFGGYGSVNLYYYTFSQPEPEEIAKLNLGLTLGNLDHDIAQNVGVGGAYSRNITITGESQWKKVQFAWEVRRVTEPKPEWLLQMEEDIQDDNKDFSDDEESDVSEEYDSNVSEQSEEDEVEEEEGEEGEDD